jgi:hypothetical protein
VAIRSSHAFVDITEGTDTSVVIDALNGALKSNTHRERERKREWKRDLSFSL